MDQELQLFITQCRDVSKFSLIEITRQHANRLIKEDNPYMAALLRELANRYEASREVK